MKAYFSDTRFGKTGWLAVVSLGVILAFMIGERLASNQTALTNVLWIKGDSSEAVAGNAAQASLTLTPAVVGSKVVNGTTGSSVYESPTGFTGSGVRFAVGGQQNSNTAFYRFLGTQTNNLLKASQGQITFTLKSKTNFATRAATATDVVFDTRDGANGRPFYFSIVKSSGRLIFEWKSGGTGSHPYFIPAGTEDTVYGTAAAPVAVVLDWGTSGTWSLKLNGVVKDSGTETKQAEPTWGTNGLLTFGADAYRGAVTDVNPGGFFACTDLIDEFKLFAPGASNPTIPTAPSALAATPASQTQINLTWADNSNNENGFSIERCANAGCTAFTLLTNVAANVTTYSDTGLTAATSYSYRVRAYNTAGNSTFATSATAITFSIAPAAPTALSAVPSSSTLVNLSWTDNATTETGFKVERCPGTTCTNFAQIAQPGSTTGIGTTTYSDTNVTASTSYVYRVRAYNAGGDSANSNQVVVTTPAGTVAMTPVKLTVLKALPVS